MNKPVDQTQVSHETKTSARPQSSLQAGARHPYQSPEIVDLGSLAQLQAIGWNWRDGSRYNDNY
jgi:hypothetical protein